MKTTEVPEPRDGVLSIRDVGGGLDVESHLVRITIDNPSTGDRVVDRLITHEAAYMLGMQLVRAAGMPNKVVIELDADKVLRGMMEEDRRKCAALKAGWEL